MEIRTDSKIYKRKDGRWCVSYYGMGANPRRHYLYGKTKNEVKMKLAELKHPIQSKQQDAEIENAEREEPVIEIASVEPEAESKGDAAAKQNGANSDAGTKWTLQEWVRYYLVTYKKNEIKETTFDSYMGIYRRRIAKSKIGKSKLEDLTGDDLQKEYNQMVSDGCKASTIRHLFILINMALNRAVQLRYIMENPNQLVTLPRKNRFEGKTLTAEEARRIFEKAKDDELYPIVALTLCTGLRKGEAMALKWENVNFEEQEIYVEGNLCRVRENKEGGRSCYVDKVLEPKTIKSRRTIPLTAKALEALQIQKQRQDEMKEKYKIIYDDQDFVFTEADGSILRQRTFMDKYHAFLKRYGISDIRFHDLRHTFATLLFEEGESAKVIQELLGHSTIAITMDIYTHVSKRGKKKAVSKLDNLF